MVKNDFFAECLDCVLTTHKSHKILSNPEGMFWKTPYILVYPFMGDTVLVSVALARLVYVAKLRELQRPAAATNSLDNLSGDHRSIVMQLKVTLWKIILRGETYTLSDTHIPQCNTAVYWKLCDK